MASSKDAPSSLESFLTAVNTTGQDRTVQKLQYTVNTTGNKGKVSVTGAKVGLGGHHLPRELKVIYHTPCHMEKMGWTLYTLTLLRQIPGLQLQVLDSQCCGIAGTYGFKSENYPTSQAIGAPLFQQIEESDADLVVTDCETCKWQIEMSTSKRCEHPISLLAQALG